MVCMGEYRSYLTNGQINENIGDWKSAVNEYEKAVLLIQKYNSFYRITPDLLHAYGRTLHFPTMFGHFFVAYCIRFEKPTLEILNVLN